MGGAPHTTKTNLGVPLGCPLPTYIKEGGTGGRPRWGAPKGGVLLGLPVQVGSGPPFLFQLGEGREGGRGEKERGGAAPSLVQFGLAMGGGGRPSLEVLLSFPIWPIKGHYFPRRIPVTLRYSEKYPNHSEPFRSPNIVVQYINVHVSTILRLLVMSVITSGTPNKLRYIKNA